MPNSGASGAFRALSVKSTLNQKQVLKKCPNCATCATPLFSIHKSDMKLKNLKPKLSPVKPSIQLAEPGRWSGSKETSSTAKGYGYRWQKARAQFLLEHPLCVMCQEAGRTTAATVVDHIRPHKGDKTLFWDSKGNWQGLCRSHHSREKQAEEVAGWMRGDA